MKLEITSSVDQMKADIMSNASLTGDFIRHMGTFYTNDNRTVHGKFYNFVFNYQKLCG